MIQNRYGSAKADLPSYRVAVFNLYECLHLGLKMGRKLLNYERKAARPQRIGLNPFNLPFIFS